MKTIIDKKPKIKVKAFSSNGGGWSFYYNGNNVGAIWYNGEIGGICSETLFENKHLK